MDYKPKAIPAHLPEKLTISFPIWAVYDTSKKQYYHDADRFMREHRERGFNCVRMDDGLGLCHDLSLNRRGTVKIRSMYGPYDAKMRQFAFDAGEVNPLERLLTLLRAAKEHDVYVILSSWFDLHTFWLVADERINDEIFNTPPHERFLLFARLLDKLLCEIEDAGLSDRVAFCELLNEADNLSFFGGGYEPVPAEKQMEFVRDHEAAIDFLRARHPEILFAFDSSRAKLEPYQIPGNVDVFNFHSYYMWNLYFEFEKPENSAPFLSPSPTLDDVVKTREGVRPALYGWFERVRFYNALREEALPEVSAWFDRRLAERYDEYVAKMDENLGYVQKLREERLPDAAVVNGEGVSYIGRVGLDWEERNPLYVKLLERMMLRHREMGLWGSVVRTCCGPEDNIWTECPELLLHLNNLFMNGK